MITSPMQQLKKNKSFFLINKFKFSVFSQEGITLKTLVNNKNVKMSTQQITDIASKEYEKLTGKKYREVTGRAIRKLAERGLIQRDKKGVFYYNGIFEKSQINEFSNDQKKIILERDNYTCLLCGARKVEGALLTVDHIIPQSKGGKADIENGMVLCAGCENRKSNYSLNSFGKKMYIKILKIAEKKNDKNTINFLNELLAIFDKYKQI